MGDIKLRDYQQEGVDEIARLAGKGFRKIVFQAPTGSGKTVTFSALTQRFIKSIDKRVLICVHRKELLKQTVDALKKVANIDAGMMIAKKRVICQEVAPDIYVPHTHAKVVVCMVETLNNRIKKWEGFANNVGMLIVDEAHRGEFNKLYEYFGDDVLRIGFTATPIAAKKRFPMKLFYEKCISPVQIRELVKMQYLAKNIDIGVKNGINRNNLKVARGDFDSKSMSELFGSSKHVKNCVNAYEKYALHTKTVIFNCNVEHSIKVMEELKIRGRKARHLDGNASEEEREETLKWLSETTDAILCSVELLTTGFDEPTIQTVIVNRSTMSLPLWIQMTGRGSRTTDTKTDFLIIDMGDNLDTHLYWDYPHDWVYYFDHPDEVRGGGVAPTKNCKHCDAIIHLSCRTCPFCGGDLSKPEVYDADNIELEILTKGVNLEDIIRRNEKHHVYASLHHVKRQLVGRFKSHYKGNYLPVDIRDQINDRFQELVKDWCIKNHKDYDRWHRKVTKEWMMKELTRIYGKAEALQQ